MPDGVAIRSLRVSADLDVSGYTQGAQAKVAADKAMSDSGKAVAASVTDTQRTVSTSSASLETLRRKTIDGYSALQDFEKGQRQATAALEAGRIAATEHASILAGLQARFDKTTGAAKDLGTGFRFTFTEMEILRSGLVNTVQSLAAGESAARTFQTQLFQTAPAFLRIGAAALGIGLPIAAVAGGMALVIARAVQVESQTRALTITLKAMGDVAGYSGAQLRSLATQLVQQGASRSDATAAVQSIIRQRSIQGPAVGQIAGLSVDVAAGLGTSVPDAAKKLADAVAGGYAGVKKLDDELGLFTAAELQNIRTMAEHGDRAGILAAALEKLHQRFDGLHTEALSPFGKAVDELSKGYDRFVENLAAHPLTLYFVRGTATITGAVADALAPGPTNVNRPGDDSDQLYQRFLKAQEQASQLEAAGHPNAGAARAGAEALRTQLQGVFASPPAPGEAGAANDNGIPIPRSKPSAPGSVSDEQSLKIVGELTEQNQKLAGAMQMVGVARDLEIAKIQAESENAQKNITGRAAELNIEQRQAEVKIRLAGAAAEVANQVKVETAQTQLVAAAYEQSEAAGLRAEAVRQATIESIKTGVPVAVRTQQLLAESAAKATEELAKQLPALDEQVAANKRLADAAALGTKAQQDAAAENQAEAVTRTALAKAIAEGNEQRILEIQLLQETIAQKLKEAQAEANRASVNQAIRQQQDQLQLGQAELALAGASAQQRAVTLAQLQAEIDLRNKGVDATSAQGQAYVANATALAQQKLALDRSNAALQEIEQFGTKAFDDLSQAIIQGSKNGLHFKDVVSSLKTEFELLIAKMALLNPLKNLFFGTNQPTLLDFGSVLGLGGAAAGAAAGAATLVPNGSGGFTLQNAASVGSLGNSIFGGGSLFGGLNNLSLGGLFNAGGAPFSATVAGPGVGSAGLIDASFGQFLGGAGAGFTAGSLLNSLVGGHQTGGLIGSGAGALAGTVLGSLVGMPFLGGLIGGSAGGLLGGLFGPHPSVGPNASALISSFQGQGAYAYGGSADNGGDAAGALALAKSVVDSANQFVKSIGGSIGGGVPAFGIGNFPSKGGYFLNFGGQSDPSQTFGGDVNAAANAAVFRILKSGAVTGLGSNTLAALKNSGASNLTDLASDLQIGQIADSLSKLKDAVTDLKTPSEQAADAVNAVGKQLDDLEAKATPLGVSLSDLQAGFAAAFDQQVQAQLDAINDPLKAVIDTEKATAAARLGVAKKLGADEVKVAELNAAELGQVMAQGAQSATGALTQIQDFLDKLRFGSSSVLTPEQQYDSALSRFNAISGAAAAGDFNSIQNVTGAADTLLGLAQARFGGGAGEVDVVNRITEALSKITDLGSGQLTEAAYTFQMRSQTKALSDKLDEVVDAIADLKAERKQASLAPARAA